MAIQPVTFRTLRSIKGQLKRDCFKLLCSNSLHTSGRAVSIEKPAVDGCRNLELYQVSVIYSLFAGVLSSIVASYEGVNGLKCLVWIFLGWLTC